MSDTSGAGLETPVETKGPQWRQLEANLTAVTAERDALKDTLGVHRGQLTQQAARLAGFQPNAEGKFEGPAALLVGEFERTIGDAVPTVEAFSALATQFGVTPPTAPLAGPGSQAGTAQPSLAEQLAAMQAPGAGITQVGSAPGLPASVGEQKEALLASGNVGGLLDLELANYRPATAG